MSLHVIRRAASEHCAALAQLHPVLQRAYAARGVRSATDLDVSLARLLPVGTLAGVPDAVRLLLAHRVAGRVLVIGDFDADGATSTALMVRALRAWGFGAVDFLVPNRFEFGYGLTAEIVALARTRAPTLIVTVDNGISSLAGVAAARAAGIEVLITDHHLPGAVLPDANVIVNPNLLGSGFGSAALAGVGVAFYVMAGLKRQLDVTGSLAGGVPGVAEFLDLVALGTVADVVPLDFNNRVLVSQGLRRIRAGRCVAGIRALLNVAGRSRADLSSTDLAFAVAPRLNAAGRIDDMTIGIECLLEDSETRAQELAMRLDELNRERRAIEVRMQADAHTAVARLQENSLHPLQRSGVCLYEESWHQGVVGLVASRVKERVRRPVFAFARADATNLRGSGRSIAGVHIRDVLDSIAARHPDLIVKFGGHAMAAGLTLEFAKLERFARAFDEEVGRCLGDRRAGRLHRDRRRACGGGDCTRHGGCRCAAAVPWGQAFPEPCFDGVFVIRSARFVGERHLKMWVEVPMSGRTFDAIAFNYAGRDGRAGRALGARAAGVPPGRQ